MLELGLFAVILVGGILFLAVKILLALVMVPLKIGIGALKVLLFLLVGMPLLIIGCAVIGLTLPFLLISGLALAALIVPFVLLVKAIS